MPMVWGKCQEKGRLIYHLEVGMVAYAYHSLRLALEKV